MRRRAWLALALAATSMGCAALVGIGDLPIDASAPRDSSTGEDVSVADVAQEEAASSDGAPDDVSAKDGAPRDAAPRDTGPRDAAMDRATMDGPVVSTDASDAAVDRKPIPDASTDRSTAPSYSLRPVDAGALCASCLEAQCCTQLGACEQGDEAGLSDAGQSACIRLTNVTLVCIVGVGDPTSGCTGANQYTPAEQQNATALVTCLQQTCTMQCSNLTAIPGT